MEKLFATVPFLNKSMKTIIRFDCRDECANLYDMLFDTLTSFWEKTVKVRSVEVSWRNQFVTRTFCSMQILKLTILHTYIITFDWWRDLNLYQPYYNQNDRRPTKCLPEKYVIYFK